MLGDADRLTGGQQIIFIWLHTEWNNAAWGRLNIYVKRNISTGAGPELLLLQRQRKKLSQHFLIGVTLKMSWAASGLTCPNCWVEFTSSGTSVTRGADCTLNVRRGCCWGGEQTNKQKKWTCKLNENAIFDTVFLSLKQTSLSWKDSLRTLPQPRNEKQYKDSYFFSRKRLPVCLQEAPKLCETNALKWIMKYNNRTVPINDMWKQINCFL